MNLDTAFAFSWEIQRLPTSEAIDSCSSFWEFRWELTLFISRTCQLENEKEASIFPSLQPSNAFGTLNSKELRIVSVQPICTLNKCAFRGFVIQALGTPLKRPVGLREGVLLLQVKSLSCIVRSRSANVMAMETD